MTEEIKPTCWCGATTTKRMVGARIGYNCVKNPRHDVNNPPPPKPEYRSDLTLPPGARCTPGDLIPWLAALPERAEVYISKHYPPDTAGVVTFRATWTREDQ